MPLSSYARNKLMDTLLSGDVHVSLHLSDPGLKGENEIVEKPYARMSASNVFLLSEDGEKKSNTDISFEMMPESTVTHIGMWDAKNGGNFLWSAELLAKKHIYQGDTLKLSAGQVILGLA